MKFTVLLTPDSEDGGYVAECPAIPGGISEGDTVDQAIANIKDAIEGCLATMAANQQPLPEEKTVVVATVDVAVPSMAERKRAALNLVEQINALKGQAKTADDYRSLTELYKQLEKLYEPE